MKKGDWVVQTRGRYKGRVGMVHSKHDSRRPPGVLIQFGADGPLEMLAQVSVRPATEEEAARREGVR